MSKVYLTGSLADNKKAINDIDIVIKLKYKPIKYSPSVCNYNCDDFKDFKKLWNKFRYVKELGIDLFFTYDFKHYFQFDYKGTYKDKNILYWGDIFKTKNLTGIKESNYKEE